MENLHPHCLKCINRRCMAKPEPGVSCNLVGCPLVCGAVFHSCKLDEHRLLCPYERLPCLNSGFGCPFTIKRIKMAQHLETCPASIVCCTMEWNRWPVSYADHKSYENLSKDFDEVEQLDMALALQDQRMLLESLKVTTNVSKNGEKGAGYGDEMVSVLGSETVEMEEEPYNNLYRASGEATRSLAAALDILTNSNNIGKIIENINGDKNGLTHNGENGESSLVAEGGRNVEMLDSNSDSECELGAVGGVDCAVETDGDDDAANWSEERNFVELHFEKKDVVINQPNQNGDLVWPRIPQDYIPLVAPEPPTHQLVPLTPPFLVSDQVRRSFCRYRCWKQNLEVLSMFTYNVPQALINPYLFRAKMEDKAVDTSDLEVEEDPMGLHGIDLITAALLFCLGDSPGGRGISDSRFVDGYHIDFGTQTFSFPSAILATNTMVGDIASASACDHASPQLSNPSPFHTLRLELVLECVARYQTKQRSMFTFVCGQLFRRDEFSSHFKNVHGDIHAGLNGWMEQRCPLAYYGCTYSQRRFCPSVQGFRIIHDRHLGSFGVQPGLPLKTGDGHSRKPHHIDAQYDQFSSLPFEVLQHIASFLDSFSLCQLSRVSRTMRNVCASLLQMRGMVVLLWEKKRRDDGSPSWQITHKVWRFSTAFGTVNEWKFADIASMADHLKKCKFNTIARREEAIPLPCMCFTRELTKEGRCLRSVLKPVA
ncbi:F-box only protein 30a [Xiphophorus couchianus]|uniref:F-box protein 30a n=1 Tax=Xiphophorus couchianus TaxID=32473 RepID=A0A3B5L303_9TELE|nr:F-box only protein 30-like [Xiphophorus couchianus]XP_027856884.1 F-box only protein 30-like [Xiphophorus couchianus]XP_027856885.1 F-box only protein 30-like [Xiphophorus couchianus]